MTAWLTEVTETATARQTAFTSSSRVTSCPGLVRSLDRIWAGWRWSACSMEVAMAVRMVGKGMTVFARREEAPATPLSEREREVLALMAEGHSNGAIARRLVVSDAAVGKHVGNILAKLDLPPDEDVHRRVQAVLAYLRGN
jgi:DNA-binding NarL/FixJ family response regulator